MIRRFLNNELASIHSAALLLGLAGFLSKILGVLRDRMLAGTFGAGRELDVYYAAFQMPDFMYTLFLLGAGSAAILPVFQKFLMEDKNSARNLISGLSSFFLAGSALAALIAFVLAGYLMKIVAPGFSEEKISDAVLLTRIMLLSPILLGLSGIFSSVSQSFRRFFPYAVAPILYNLGIISGIAFFVPRWGLKGLAFGVILGAFLHFILHFYSVSQLQFRPGFKFREVFPGVRRVLVLSLPRVMGLSLSQLTFMALIALGSVLSEGSISSMNLAYNLFVMPVGVFGVSYAIALFPRLSEAFLKKDGEYFLKEFNLGITTILFWTIPLSLLLIILRAHIVRAALGTGVFSWEDTRLTAALLGAFSFSLFIFSLLTLLIRGFYALGSTWSPLRINIAGFLVAVGSGYFFIKLLASPGFFSKILGDIFRIGDLPNFQVLGLALGFALGQALEGILLYLNLRNLAEKKLGVKINLPWKKLSRILVSSGVAGVFGYTLRVSFSETISLETFFAVLGEGLAVGLVFFAIYFFALYLLKSEEVLAMYSAFKKKMFKIKILPKEWNGQDYPTL